MRRKCLICNTEYHPEDSSSFFNFKYCSDPCELKAEVEARSAATGIHMYMCISPFSIIFLDENNNEIDDAAEEVSEGSKWRRDDSQYRGRNKIHLINLSGRKDEPIQWLEVDEQALKEHFQKI